MLVQYYFPASLSAKRLDRYLAAGWFRSGQALFRSELICLDENIFTPVNIRLKLEKYLPKKRHRKIINRNQKRFQTIIRPASVSAEKDRLYRIQSTRFKGFIFNSLAHFLQDETSKNVFNTWEVCVYDGDELIAVSFFDKGYKGAASILGLNSQDEKYAKYSLGVYTMLMEMLHLKEEGKKFYYPGYVLDQESIFDYKLRMGKIYYYDWKGRWKNYENLETKKLTVQKFKEAIHILEKLLAKEEIPFKKMYYPLFSLGYLDFFNENFFRSIIYFQVKENQSADELVLLSYDIENKEYFISEVKKRPDYQMFVNPHRADDFQNTDLYCFDLLSESRLIFKDQSPEKVIEELSEIVLKKEVFVKTS